MKTFLAEIIPRIQSFSKKLDDLSVLSNHHWVSLGDILNSKTVFIFRENGLLLLSENGFVEKGKWEYLGNDSLLFEYSNKVLLLKYVFADEHIMALRLDGSEGYIFFINESRYGNELNTINDVMKFLQEKYLNKSAGGIILDHPSIPGHTESTPIESFDIMYGKHERIKIKFADNIEGEIFYGYSSKKFFFNHFTWAKNIVRPNRIV